MGLLDLFSESKNPSLARLPAGSFTLDGQGRLMTSTLPHSFPAGQLQEIGKKVLAAFQAAQTAEMPLSEMVIQYTALKLQVRKLNNGAIVFLAPQTLKHKPNHQLVRQRLQQ